MITKEFKLKIIEALKQARGNFYGSDAKFATSIGISGSQYSRIKNGETERILSDASWIALARLLDVNPAADAKWQTAKTPVFQFINAQLEVCQREGLSSLLCDFSDIGKSHAAQHYARQNRNAVYIDCSQVKSKQKLIRRIAQLVGIGGSGRYADVYENLVYYLKTIPNPMIILDEAGDLQHDAFLEVKALWNATEHCCGYYMMGADGLQHKMSRSIDNKKVGYTELFSRFGKRYGKVIPVGDESKKLLETTALMIIKANAPQGSDYNKILRNTMGEDGRPSLRRIFNELAKRK
ncbi:AAA family ATPase [Maribellus mangrovi]|uniref:AAA family ATPase n=1 Tax=Maribellus mangrovi TaxID=3133146 RepID=UPI0030EB8C9D